MYWPPDLTKELTSLLYDCLAHLASAVYDECEVDDFNCGAEDRIHNLCTGSSTGSSVKHWSICCLLIQYCALPTRNEKTLTVYLYLRMLLLAMLMICLFSTSDHAVIRFKYKIPKIRYATCNVRNFKLADCKGFQNYLASIQLHVVFATDQSVNKMWFSFI